MPEDILRRVEELRKYEFFQDLTERQVVESFEQVWGWESAEGGGSAALDVMLVSSDRSRVVEVASKSYGEEVDYTALLEGLGKISRDRFAPEGIEKVADGCRFLHLGYRYAFVSGQEKYFDMSFLRVINASIFGDVSFYVTDSLGMPDTVLMLNQEVRKALEEERGWTFADSVSHPPNYEVEWDGVLGSQAPGLWSRLRGTRLLRPESIDEEVWVSWFKESPPKRALLHTESFKARNGVR